MRASEQCREAVKEFEGLKLKSYRCTAGVLTIGYGHTHGVKAGQCVTVSQAESLLTADIRPIERYLNSLGIRFTQGQFDALTDFCFNLGIGALKGSTLMKLIILKSDEELIQAEFGKWVYCKGKKMRGLIKRRAWEARRWADRG